jgi:AcrR family transcriptional regulator
LARLAGRHQDAALLSRGQSAPPRDVVLAAHRQRLLRATVELVAAKGYAATTVADIVAGARVSRAAFYEQFADKADCFLVATEEGCELMFDSVTAAPRALPSSAGAHERLTSAIRAYLRFLVTEPEFARVFLLELFAAGPVLLERRAEAHARFAALTHEWHARARHDRPSWPQVPAAFYSSLVGAIYELAAERVRERRSDSLEELLDPIVELHMTVLARPATGGVRST